MTIAAIGLNLTLGYAGQVSLAQAAFVGIGAYITALLTTKGWPFWPTYVLGGVACFAVGWLLGYPALRVEHHYLAFVTLAFTTQFIKAARDGDVLTILGAWRPSTSQSTFAAETEIYDQNGDLIATGAGTFRYLKGERSDGVLHFLDKEAAD